MRGLYFGTKERMTWVRPPSIDADISKGKWSAEGGFLNGGAFVRGSSTGHKRYRFTWNLAAQEDIYDILDYADGLYGDGLIYFLEPFSAPTNCLPQFWAAPRLQNIDAPPLTHDVRPTLVNTASNVFSYPTKSAVYTFTSTSTFDSLWIPIPPDYTLHFGAHGSATGTATITVQADGDTHDAVTLLGVTGSTLTNTTVVGASGATISAEGEGQLTLAGLVAQVLPTGVSAPTGDFISGRGHSGCRFVPSSVTIQGYSAPEALDKVAATALLVEVGAWEQ